MKEQPAAKQLAVKTVSLFLAFSLLFLRDCFASPLMKQ
jgi:hypothetical protein